MDTRLREYDKKDSMADCQGIATAAPR